MLLDQILKAAGPIGITVLGGILIVVLGWVLYKLGAKRGIKFPWTDKYLVPPPKEELADTKTEPEEPIIVPDYEVLVGSVRVGYYVPRPYVYLYGKEWNTESHRSGYKELDRLWVIDQVPSIYLIDTNITSTLVSLLDSKVKQTKKDITIFCSSEQEKLLSHFKQYPHVKFEIR